jgi:hypothetical protein
MRIELKNSSGPIRIDEGWQLVGIRDGLPHRHIGIRTREKVGRHLKWLVNGSNAVKRGLERFHHDVLGQRALRRGRGQGITRSSNDVCVWLGYLS